MAVKKTSLILRCLNRQPSLLVQAMSAWLVKTRRAPSWHDRDARVYDSKDCSHAWYYYPPPPPRRPDVLRPRIEGIIASTILRRRSRMTMSTRPPPLSPDSSESHGEANPMATVGMAWHGMACHGSGRVGACTFGRRRRSHLVVVVLVD